jgi:5-(carboxyamino)imidazole ribonucleotide mutase
MLAAKTIVPVLGVPVPSKHLNGLDSLLSIVQMPKGVPVATFAIGEAGAANAALTAVAIIATANDERGKELARKLDEFRARQSEKVMAMKLELPT